MKALVSGGAGFIGSHLADALVSQGEEVLVVDDLSSGLRENVSPKAHFKKIDICDFPRLEKVFQEFRPEVVFHLAAHIDLRESFKNPVHDAQSNILGSLNLLELMRDSGAQKFVFSSTGGAIYGEASKIPTPETYFAIPASPYGISKLVVEYYLNVWRKLHGINFVALRYSNVYGPRQGGRGEAGVVSIFISKLIKSEQISIFGDGEQTRDFVYVTDVVSANLAAARFGESGVFNVSTGVGTSVNEIFEKLKNLALSDSDLVYGPTVKGEIPRSVLDPRLAKRVLGWNPKVPLDQGLAETLEYFRA